MQTVYEQKRSLFTASFLIKIDVTGSRGMVGVLLGIDNNIQLGVMVNIATTIQNPAKLGCCYST